MDARELLRARLLVVTGKGGTGKTSVAAALAVAAAAKGHEVLLAEVEGRQGLARLFDLPALGHEEAPIGERLTGLAIDPKAALREYLDGTGVPVLGTLLDRAGLGDLVTAAAPGLGDVLLAGKLAQVARRSVYDLVVLDAPPSGRIVPFLGAAAGLAGLARFGPVADQAGGVAELLTDPALTQVVLTTLPEALPVTEALQTAAALRAAGIPVGPAIANQVGEGGLSAGGDRLPALAADPAPLRAAARAAGLQLSDADLAALAGEGLRRERRLDAERRQLARLRDGLGVDLIELPVVPGGVTDPAGVDALARRLRRVGPRAVRALPAPGGTP
jgi:anion-transporting  ArsA/GET3 family ATPase